MADDAGAKAACQLELGKGGEVEKLPQKPKFMGNRVGKTQFDDPRLCKPLASFSQKLASIVVCKTLIQGQ